MKRLLNLALVIAVFGIVSIIAQEKKSATAAKNLLPEKKPLVTFVELGSVKCIPCRQMQPVMKAIEKKYGDQVKVVFYDVWKPDQRKYAEQYGIKLIPTQVFLDAAGKELFRHEGFYPEAEIDKLLQKQGLKIQTGG
jgi:thioredoxin 1